jgi:hypothetical protein
LLPQIAHLTVRSSQFNDPKIKIQKQKSHGLPTPFQLFSYIKREMRERQRRERRKKKETNKRDKRNKNQNQTISTSNGITFDRKLRLRRATRPRKACDEILKSIILTLKNVFEVYLKFLVRFFSVFS